MGCDDIANRFTRGGENPTPDCVSQGIFGLAVFIDHSGQNIAICNTCRDWWFSQLPKLHEDGRIAAAKGERIAVPSLRFSPNIMCESYPNLCATSTSPPPLTSSYASFGYFSANIPSHVSPPGFQHCQSFASNHQQHCALVLLCSCPAPYGQYARLVDDKIEIADRVGDRGDRCVW